MFGIGEKAGNCATHSTQIVSGGCILVWMGIFGQNNELIVGDADRISAGTWHSGVVLAGFGTGCDLYNGCRALLESGRFLAGL